MCTVCLPILWYKLEPLKNVGNSENSRLFLSLSLSSVGISAGFRNIIILKNFSFLLLGEEGLLHFLKCCCTLIYMISRLFYFTLSVELITRSLPNAERSLHSWGKAYRVMVCFLLIHWKFPPIVSLAALAFFLTSPSSQAAPGRRRHSLYLCAEHQAIFAVAHLKSSPPPSTPNQCLKGTGPTLPTQSRLHPGCRPVTQNSSLAPPSRRPTEFTLKHSCLLPPPSWPSHLCATVPLPSCLLHPPGLPHPPVMASAEPSPGLAALPPWLPG